MQTFYGILIVNCKNINIPILGNTVYNFRNIVQLFYQYLFSTAILKFEKRRTKRKRDSPTPLNNSVAKIAKHKERACNL